MMPISRLKAKLLANGASMIGALLMLTFLFTALNNKALIDDLGKVWVNAYQGSYSSEVRGALVELSSGQTDHAIDLLAQSDWSSVRLGDRGYRFKRQILSNLCRTLYNNKDYQRLLDWATAWRVLDERDVNAIAYNYEALRHTDGRRKEGREGLLEYFKKFPANGHLQRFYVWALFDAGEVEQATALAEKYLSPDWVRSATVGWELRWQWKTRHVITNYVRLLKQHLANGDWGDAWKVPNIPSQLQPRHNVDEDGIFVSVDWSEESNINAADIEREIAVTLDSGAVDHVISTELLPAQTEICEVTGSRVGKRLVAANGQPMQTFGECILECEDDTGKSAGSFAVTEVSRALQSVSRICDQDLEVLFTKSEARIRDPKTGKYVARYARKGGLYTRIVRVRPGSKPDSSARPKPAATGGGRRPGPFTRPSKKP